MLITAKSGRTFEIPTEEEESLIEAGILADSDASSYSDKEWDDVLPSVKRRGRPLSKHRKKIISIRLSQDVLEGFKATGAGWQTRIDGILKEWLKTHHPTT